jgi:PAS domain S-box-containing protein
LTIRKVAVHVTQDERTRDRIRALIDRLQIAVLAIDDGGNYLAASPGVTTLTGYMRAELLTKSIFDTAFGVTLPLARMREEFIRGEHDIATTAISNKEGRPVTIHTSFATILPGLHIALMARAETHP